MELKEDETGWYLALSEGSVQLIQIDFRLGLLFREASSADGARLDIGEPCYLKGPGGRVPLTPGETSTHAPILPFFNAKVIGIAIQETGHLKVEFTGNRFLEIDPNDRYEAWELGCSIGFKLICSPGGSVAVFEFSDSSARATG